MIPGRFIAVVGPSGVGKDTVMEAVCARHPEIRRVRRVITRSAEAGCEDAEAVTPEEFEAQVRRGDFALHWQAHGMRYGIPASVDAELSAGRDVLANLSRAVLPELEKRFDRSMIVSITASPQVLAARLAARGRETAEEQAKRLQRADFRLAEGLNPVVIRNDGTLDEAVAAFSAALQPERA
ncbi:phosphonate metabolism protein/1,5-bisphosphokinase (PRPP-forming) PhnN [Thalassovita aquimarina]|uniref:Ribose 1,5-bisphosphate phosphokinase PhnN n=1 Tax=Thalassovita aquimarina TaxID=2785917 RepID=A0ABS5HNJ1_9RHOB|nr:phosphonate metabolism protein/1,5-bisphosphokinase (PRPP-forming) PhnN [Thalassovita aquimarina]MBR9650536.1 phosphonate metabolism protein/1,5-bisphosphokinase (PRPP-forming) PhnN [Thalassovita aquimarina]